MTARTLAACAWSVALAGAAAAQETPAPDAPASDAPATDGDPATPPIPRSSAAYGLQALPLQFSVEAELLFIWRQTGQVWDYHDYKGDTIDMSKDLHLDRSTVRPRAALHMTGGTRAHPFALHASFIEFDMHGEGDLPRQNLYGLYVLPKGEPTRTDVFFTKSTLETTCGFWGYDGAFTRGWSMDVVAGAWLWTAEWAIATQNFGTINGRAGDPRLYAGLEFHKPLAEWLVLDLRGVIGNPSGVLGGYTAGVRATFGAVAVRASLQMGAPAFGEWNTEVAWTVSPRVTATLVWREWFDQVDDGGSWFNESNESWVRLHHTLIGAGIRATF